MRAATKRVHAARQMDIQAFGIQVAFVCLRDKNVALGSDATSTGIGSVIRGSDRLSATEALQKIIC